MGKEARKSMKKFNNELLYIRWIKLILSIFNGYNYYEEIKKLDKKLSIKEDLNILKMQVNFLKIRNTKFKNISCEIIENFSSLEKYLREEFLLKKRIKWIYNINIIKWNKIN